MRVENKWYRSRQDRVLSGAAAGLGAYLGVHPALVRVALLVLAFGGILAGPAAGLVFVAYLAAWVLVPEMPPEIEPRRTPLIPGLERPREGRIIAGVAAGLARQLNVEVNFVRVAFIVLTAVFGMSLIVYVALWVLMPDAPAGSISH